MPLTTSQELEHRTRVFWQLSRQFNGQSDTAISTKDAIDMCNTTFSTWNHARPLVKASERLLDEMIKGEARYFEEPGKVKWLSKHSRK